MINFIYQTLAAIGYTHPLHAVITHLPMGLILGGCLFAVASYKKPALLETAKNCYYMALLFVPPTILFGIMDWQYRLYGKWSGLITAKLILGTLLLVLNAAAVYTGKKENANQKVLFALYIASALNAIALGFTGGEILYG